MSESKVSLKLLIDTKSKRVLFAEAGKDFVDFIFHILSLPLATVIRLIGKNGMVGCLGNLYDSIENLNDSYIQHGQTKDVVLKPKVQTPITSVPLLLLKNKPTEKSFYGCSHCYTISNISDDPTVKCPKCWNSMKQQMKYVAPARVIQESNDGGGLVKGVVTYMVMDDLMVKPVSTISSIALLNQFNVKEMGALKEKEVNFGMKEVVLGNKMVFISIIHNFFYGVSNFNSFIFALRL